MYGEGGIDVDEQTPMLESNADTLDAAVCVLAAKDFLEGRACQPVDLDLAVREGWIWAPPWQPGVKPNKRKESVRR
jgi:hypothetical protein